ncbi:MAG: helicase HerA domain-containing protein, partial [Dehalococcoidia bacterium]
MKGTHMQSRHDDLSAAALNGAAVHDDDAFVPNALSGVTLDAVDQLGADAGGAWSEREEDRTAIGRTMFDLPTSEDDTVTVLLPKAEISKVPSQSLVRIKSLDDRRTYLAVVIKGPFAEPDGLRADAPVVVTTSVRGAVFMPHYHGRVQAELLGEELEDGTVVPQRFRPLPNSRVYVLDSEDTARVLRTGGQLLLGRAVGHDDLPVGVPVEQKSVLPRHLGVLGTTGGGKSTTVAGMVEGLQRAGAAVILFDTEGEYTEIHEPANHPPMLAALSRVNRLPAGVANTTVHHLVGREPANPRHPRPRPFSLHFPSLSPYAVMELLELTEAQQERYLKAYDATRRLLDRLKIFPATQEQQAEAALIDDLEEGVPQLTLQRLYDVVAAMAAAANKTDAPPYFIAATLGQEEALRLFKEIVSPKDVPGSVPSWRALQGKLGRILRLKIFDIAKAGRIEFAALLRPGTVNIIDLSDVDTPAVRNLAIT